MFFVYKKRCFSINFCHHPLKYSFLCNEKCVSRREGIFFYKVIKQEGGEEKVWNENSFAVRKIS